MYSDKWCIFTQYLQNTNSNKKAGKLFFFKRGKKSHDCWWAFVIKYSVLTLLPPSYFVMLFIHLRLSYSEIVEGILWFTLSQTGQNCMSKLGNLWTFSYIRVSFKNLLDRLPGDNDQDLVVKNMGFNYTDKINNYYSLLSSLKNYHFN